MDDPWEVPAPPKTPDRKSPSEAQAGDLARCCSLSNPPREQANEAEREKKRVGNER